MNKPLNIVCYGEILWDLFPDEKRLGGAPLNVAMRFQSLGANVTMLSSVGSDDLGKEALQLIAAQGLDTSNITINPELLTGTVTVTLKEGIPSYRIDENVAWDAIAIGEQEHRKVENADALIFGSLALRKTSNFNTINTLLKDAKYAIFDLNLREPFYSEELILSLMKKAHFVKMNDEELEYVCQLLEIKSVDLEERLQKISECTSTNSICVTLGANGACLLHNNQFYTHTGYRVEISDTVGAGDSFLAGLVFSLLQVDPPQKALAFACALGALVASKAGANCKVAPSEISSLTA